MADPVKYSVEIDEAGSANVLKFFDDAANAFSTRIEGSANRLAAMLSGAMPSPAQVPAGAERAGDRCEQTIGVLNDILRQIDSGFAASHTYLSGMLAIMQGRATGSAAIPAAPATSAIAAPGGGPPRAPQPPPARGGTEVGQIMTIASALGQSTLASTTNPISGIMGGINSASGALSLLGPEGAVIGGAIRGITALAGAALEAADGLRNYDSGLYVTMSELDLFTEGWKIDMARKLGPALSDMIHSFEELAIALGPTIETLAKMTIFGLTVDAKILGFLGANKGAAGIGPGVADVIKNFNPGNAAVPGKPDAAGMGDALKDNTKATNENTKATDSVEDALQKMMNEGADMGMALLGSFDRMVHPKDAHGNPIPIPLRDPNFQGGRGFAPIPDAVGAKNAPPFGINWGNQSGPIIVHPDAMPTPSAVRAEKARDGQDGGLSAPPGFRFAPTTRPSAPPGGVVHTQFGDMNVNIPDSGKAEGHFKTGGVPLGPQYDTWRDFFKGDYIPRPPGTGIGIRDQYGNWRDLPPHQTSEKSSVERQQDKATRDGVSQSSFPRPLPASVAMNFGDTTISSGDYDRVHSELMQWEAQMRGNMRAMQDSRFFRLTAARRSFGYEP